MIVTLKQLTDHFMSVYDKIRDLPNEYEYFYTKEVNGELRVWGAYSTYWRWHWDNKGMAKRRDKVILFSGVLGKKFRYTKSWCNDRLPSYATKHRKDGYKCYRYENKSERTLLGEPFNELIKEKFPDIHEGISKQIFWLTLKD